MIGVEGVESPGIHERREIGITHLLDLTAGGTDQMGVRQGDALILGLHSFKYMPSQHLGLDEQFHGIIDGRTAHTETVTVNHLLQLLNGKVAIDAHDAVQDGIALGRLAHSMSVKILIELANGGVIAGNKFFDM